jgi:hypothetical protein
LGYRFIWEERRMTNVPHSSAYPFRRAYSFRVLWPDGSWQTGSAEMSVPPQWEELRAYVEPYLDAPMAKIRIAIGVMFVDDIAQAKGLPRNEDATVLYRADTLAALPGLPDEALAFVSGPAVVFERPT